MTSESVRRVDAAVPGAAIASEWLLTNTLGGFALGTALGVNTRRYHGWLVAAMSPPVDRVVALHSVVDELVLPDTKIDLATFQFGDDLTRYPGGWRHLRMFEVETPHRVTWTFVVGRVSVTRTLRLARGINEASVTYDVDGAPPGTRLRLRPLVPLRGFHTLDREAEHRDAFRVLDHADGARIVREDRCMWLTADAASPGVWENAPQWWRNFAYPEERSRGQDWREDVFSPGVFDFTLAAGASTVTLNVAAGATRPMRPDPTPTACPEPAFASADQFIVRRGDSTSIIAGYPWFADWGRDTMISLPGLLLATGRFAEARSVLTTFASRIEGGLLPNCFDDWGGAPNYNTADAGLWFIHAVRAYARASGDENLDPLLDACRAVVSAYRRGTRHGIGVGADGLLIAGDGREPVTWMDARRGGITFTPRDGKPVELSALWYNALLGLAELVDRSEADADEAAELRERAGQTALAMQMYFWWPERSCLHDVLRPGEHDWEGDARLRPNQIFAVSLPFSPLTAGQQACVVEVVRERLLTPYGLRTLDRDDPEYRARYEGDLMARDAAYHNGTVWPWLIGAYCDALLRVNGDSRPARAEVRAVLQPLRDEFDRGCLGQIAEVYDADPPHRASGCPAQAWSVAEVMRILGLLDP